MMSKGRTMTKHWSEPHTRFVGFARLPCRIASVVKPHEIWNPVALMGEILHHIISQNQIIPVGYPGIHS